MASKNKNITKILDGLASKADEVSSLHPRQMVQLCDEILANIYNRPDEWSHAGNWTSEWNKVDELISLDEDNNNIRSPSSQNSASTMRMALGDFTSKLLESYRLSYQSVIDDTSNNNNNNKLPPFLKNVRKVCIGENEFSVYGRVKYNTFPGHSLEVWTNTNKEATEANRDIEKGTLSSTTSQNQGKISLVLGAGNQPVISFIDIIECFFSKRMPVLLKHHPLRPVMMEPCKVILEPLLKRGFVVQIVDEGIPKTTEILKSSQIGHVHITGSLATDEAVRATLKEARPSLSDSQINNMVTSELGAVTPAILLPAKYTKKELIHAARIMVTNKKLNGGCNCLNINAVVLPKDWDQKDQFRNILREELSRQPDAPAYYPGTRDRKRRLQKTYEMLGEGRAVTIEGKDHKGLKRDPQDSVVLLECGTPGEPGYEGSALLEEAFGPVLAIVELPGGGGGTERCAHYFSNVLSPFMNNKKNLFGTLSCSVFSPSSVDADVVEAGVASLQYGAVTINCPTVLGYMGIPIGGVWGGHHTDKGRQSGHGVIGNAFGLQNVNKMVVHGSPLKNIPLFDGANPPPTIVLDALHAATCAPTTLVGAARVLQVLFVRSTASLASLFLPKQSVNDFVLKFGKALV